MEMEAGLSRGLVAGILSSEDGAHLYMPERHAAAVLQVVGLEHQSLPVCRTPRRWMTLSDGVRSVHGGIPSSMDHLVEDGDLRPGTMLHLLEYHCVTSQSIRIFTFVKFEILQTECTRIEHGQGIRLSSTALRPAEKSANLTYTGYYGEFHSAGGGIEIEAGHVRKTFAEIKADNLDCSYYPYHFIVVKATPTSMNKESICYTACPLVVEDSQCCMEVSRNRDGWWYCHSCNQTFASCDYRYRILIQLQDSTGMIYAPASERAGKDIFGCTAKELYMMKIEQQDCAQFDDIVGGGGGALFHDFLFELLETRFLDKKFPKCTILRAKRVNPSTENHHLLREINKLKESSGSTVVCRISVGSRIAFSYLEARQRVHNSGGDQCAMNNRGAWDLRRVWMHATGRHGSCRRKHHAWFLPKVWLPQRFSSVFCLWRSWRRLLTPRSLRRRTYGVDGCGQHSNTLLASQTGSNIL